jgi:hypothetical protein
MMSPGAYLAVRFGVVRHEKLAVQVPLSHDEHDADRRRDEKHLRSPSASATRAPGLASCYTRSDRHTFMIQLYIEAKFHSKSM